MSQQIAHAAPGISDPARTSANGTEAMTGPTATTAITPAQADGGSTTDAVLRWVKELVASLIGLALVVCLMMMIWRAFEFLGRGKDDPSFQNVKDLLLFINPLVGVVIGYYFNRVSTEARAESAERTAQVATTTTQQAQLALGEAETQAQSSKEEADEATSVLQDIIPSAQDALSQLPQPSPQILGSVGTASVDPAAVARVNLQRSLERARALVARRNR